MHQVEMSPKKQWGSKRKILTSECYQKNFCLQKQHNLVKLVYFSGKKLTNENLEMRL